LGGAETPPCRTKGEIVYSSKAKKCWTKFFRSFSIDTEQMKQLEEIHPPVTRFEQQTGNCPLLMATVMLDQLKNYFWTDLPDDLADEVAAKAETVFAGNERWRKKFQGARGLEYLEMFMRHWFSSALFRRKSPLFRQLPPDFKVGRPLPKVSLPRQLGKSSPRKTRRKPVKAHPAGRYIHGCELLAA
jgi:hypothetical protein